jgi:zinc-binding alcohol dehydrogenase family protein
MRAVALLRHLPITDPDALIDVEVPIPDPGPRDLLVKVAAVAVNPVDTKVRRRNLGSAEQTPLVLGWDATGVVERVGLEVTAFAPGDDVWYAGDITRPGCNSEWHLVDERIAARKPRSLDVAAAASLPLTALTAWEAFFHRLGLDPDGRDRGTTLLILGGAGGVGSIAIQLAKLAGLTVLATASRPETSRWVREHGADHAIDHSIPIRPQIEALGLSHVEVIANFVDTNAYWDTVCDLVAPQGRVCNIVGASGPVNLGALMQKSVLVAWELMFTRPTFRTPDMDAQRAILTRIAELVDRGAVRHTMTERMQSINAANLREAHARIESGRTIGKIVLEGWPTH